MTSGKALLIAGNGSIGRRVAVALSAEGRQTIVHHAGARQIPQGAHISEIVVERTPLPIIAFPSNTTQLEADAAIHFMCMGAADATAFVAAFDGKAKRLVLISSCDVYRAYGRFSGLEPGPPDPTPLNESAPLRSQRYPYRARASDETRMEYWYEKRDAEDALSAARSSEVTVLRLPKVYGPDANADLATVYGYERQADFRWTHGHVDNVAASIALAAFHPAAAGQTFNLGELRTPTMGERLSALPSRRGAFPLPRGLDFNHQLHFDTRKIRDVLGYRDVVDEVEAMRVLAAARSSN